MMAVSVSLACSVALAPGAWAQAENTGEPAAEDGSLTPLSEFAPEEVRPARGETYDQGLTINKISIEGNRLIEEDKIKETMASRPGSLYSKRNLQSDLRRIYDMGYFTEKIKAVPIATNAGIHLRIEVEENAPVTGVNIEGNTIIKDEEIQKIFAGQTGLPQNIGQLNESIEKIEKLYADKGFVLARVKSISDDPDGVINLEVNEGAIEKIQFVGNRKTRDSVLKRMMYTREGNIYNEKLLSEDLKRVFNTQSFSDIRRVITVSPDNPDKYNLTVEFDEKKTGAISLGGGVDTATGFFGSLGYNDPNFLGRGQNFSSGLGVGTGVFVRGDAIANSRTYQFDVGWSNPALFDSVNSLAVNAYGRDLASFNVPLGIERRIGSEITWSRPFLSTKSLGGSLALRAEDVSLRDGARRSTLREFGINDDERKQMLEGGTFISLSPTIAYDTRDNRLNPSSGWLNTISVTGAYGLGADSYGTALVNLRKYFKIRDGVTLAFNAQGGTSAFGDIPQFNMFRLGGAYNVRGFQEGGLGAGGGFIMGSAELRTKLPFLAKLKSVPLMDTFSAAFFADAGQLLDTPSTNKIFDRPNYGISVGAGIRLNLPGVGPIRIDYAVPIANGDSRYVQRFNFGVGQKF
jgi:outer membrane protein insertion porin family